MPLFGMVATLIVVTLGSLLFSALTYALRDLPRVRLAEFLSRKGRDRWIDATSDNIDDLVFVTAVWRMFFNTAIVVVCLVIVERGVGNRPLAYALAALLAAAITLIFSVAIPSSLAQYAAAEIVGNCAALLHALRLAMTPITAIMHRIDEGVRSITGASATPEAAQVQQEIMSVVEEGEKE